jgi:hypothetical protein
VLCLYALQYMYSSTVSQGSGMQKALGLHKSLYGE